MTPPTYIFINGDRYRTTLHYDISRKEYSWELTRSPMNIPDPFPAPGTTLPDGGESLGSVKIEEK